MGGKFKTEIKFNAKINFFLKGGTPALRLVALSTPRDQTLSGTVLLLPAYTICPSARSLAQASFLHLSLAHILCELRRARAHA